MRPKFSKELCTVLEFAHQEAMRTGCYGIGEAHLLLAILRSRGSDALRAIEGCGLDKETLKEAADKLIFNDKPIPLDNAPMVRPTKRAEGVIALAGYEALRHGTSSVSSSHLLLALCRRIDGQTSPLLYEAGADYDRIEAYLRTHGMLNSPCSVAPVNMETILGSLGEQLTALFGASRDKTNFLS